MEAGGAKSSGPGTEARLIARDDKKNPLISTFDWTDDAVQRIFRVPAGFMRNKTQERVEELARERAATAIDLALVEDGIEFGKKMMAEMIATYSPHRATSPPESRRRAVAPRPAPLRRPRRKPRRWRLPQRGEIALSLSSYRFCRTDDVALLVDALNRCWAPYFPDEPPVTPASFKRSIRHLQVWCSSCMVAFSGADPIGVLIGAKRPSGTLIHKIAVHPDHRRQGHGRHLLTSLGSKLAILGPPRMIAEVPETLSPPARCSAHADMSRKRVLTDYVLPA